MCVDVCLSRHCPTVVADTASSVRRMSVRFQYSDLFFIRLLRGLAHLHFNTTSNPPSLSHVIVVTAMSCCEQLFISCDARRAPDHLLWIEFFMMLNCTRVRSISLMSETNSISLACAREFQHTFDVQGTRCKNDLNTSC